MKLSLSVGISGRHCQESIIHRNMFKNLALRRQGHQYKAVALSIFVIGLACSSLLAYRVKIEENKKIELTLQLRSLLISSTLQQNVTDDLDALKSVYSFYDLSRDLSAQDFQEFFATEFQERESIKSLSWAPLVTQASYSQFVAENQGKFTEIQSFHTQEGSEAQPNKEEYFPVLYSASRTVAENNLGFDLTTSATLKETIDNSRASQNMVATFVVDNPAVDTLEELTILVFLPVYRSSTLLQNAPGSTSELAGFFVAELLVFNVIRDAFDELNMGGIDVFVTEELDSQRLLHVHKKRDGEYVDGSLQDLDRILESQNITSETSITVSGYDWNLLFVPNANFFASQQTNYWLIVLGAAACITTLISLYIKHQGEHALSTQKLLRQLDYKNNQLEATLSDLKKTQSQAIQTEKLSALGKMVGGIAHEINNPVSFIAGNLKYLEQEFSYLIQLVSFYQDDFAQSHKFLPEPLQEIDTEFMKRDLPKSIESMTYGTDRICRIVSALKTFSRIDESGRKKVDLHGGIDSTLVILSHRLKLEPSRREISVTTEYASLPPIECLPSQINQVFLNLLNNAIDSIQEKWSKVGERSPDDDTPQIWITTEVTEVETVRIRIADNGMGVPDDIKHKLFDPFFSTKE